MTTVTNPKVRRALKYLMVFAAFSVFFLVSIRVHGSAMQMGNAVGVGPTSVFDEEVSDLFVPIVVELDDPRGDAAKVQFPGVYTPFEELTTVLSPRTPTATCYERLVVNYAYTASHGWGVGTHTEGSGQSFEISRQGTKLCVRWGIKASHTGSVNVTPSESRFPVETNSFFYPFDTAVLKLRIYGRANLRNYHGVLERSYTFTPTIRVTAYSPEWEIVEIWQPDSQMPGEAHENTIFGEHWNFGVIFQRPGIYQDLAVVLGCLILVAILSLLFVQELGSLIEASVGILFGMWGARQVVLRDFVQWLTIVDVVLIWFYILLATVLLVRLLLNLRFFREEPKTSQIRDGQKNRHPSGEENSKIQESRLTNKHSTTSYAASLRHPKTGASLRGIVGIAVGIFVTLLVFIRLYRKK